MTRRLKILITLGTLGILTAVAVIFVWQRNRLNTPQAAVTVFVRALRAGDDQAAERVMSDHLRNRLAQSKTPVAQWLKSTRAQVEQGGDFELGELQGTREEDGTTVGRVPIRFPQQPGQEGTVRVRKEGSEWRWDDR